MKEKTLGAGKTLAFHSYRGGTGKTTLAANLAATFANKGLNVCLFDFDLYAPSLCSYFRKTPEFYLNDLLAGKAELSDMLLDVGSELGVDGKFLLGLSSPNKDDIHEIEIRHDLKWQRRAIERFLAVKKELFSKYNIDYIFLDTSPGIRYWSINAILVSEIMFLMMKVNEMDVIGTKKMINDIYESLTEFGSKYYIILNKVSGASPLKKFQEKPDQEALFEFDIETNIDTKVIQTIPCFCDIQFEKSEFLYAIKNPKHLFSSKVLSLANKICEYDQFQCEKP